MTTRQARRRSGNPPSVLGVSRSSGTVTTPATGTSFARFLWIFTTLGLIVVVVVIGFLIGIVRALESIDDGLFTASNSVTGATADVQSLPNYIQQINAALSDIDAALKPIPGQVAEVSDSLQSIRGSAGEIDASLKDTAGSLTDTSGSLADTSGSLEGASQSAGGISGSPQPGG